MSTTTANTKTLEIDGMTGDVCVKKVTDALKGVKGVTIDSVSVGEATIKADDVACKAACAAIKTAGYEANLEQDDSDEDDNGNKNESSKGTQGSSDTLHQRSPNAGSGRRETGQPTGNPPLKQPATKS